MKAPACGLVCLALAAGAPARPVLDRATLEIGVGASELGGKVAVNGSAGVLGTDIDIGRDLDIGGRDRGKLFAATWSPWERHEFGARVQRFGRNGERTISREIVFDDEVFVVNSRVEGAIELDLWSLDYTGWVIAQEGRALGLSVGALQYRLGLSLAARNLPGGAQPAPVEAEVKEDLPVLVLGAEYREALGDDWRLVLRGSVFQADINRIDGTVYTFDGGVEYSMGPHATLALRYSATRLDAHTRREDLKGRLRLDLEGLQGALIWRW
ncbi:MAG: hypothetical protein IPK27_18945 [Rhodanobacteraceae bacterium]|nr:hypothetical protein [Rhodanobacteraceae bacterium]